ncbi:hypothetical protein G6F56_013741 [Rhizopus delemar]|nr:hypothetical protein G6F56_013741 [Rhizopus delemar]
MAYNQYGYNNSSGHQYHHNYSPGTPQQGPPQQNYGYGGPPPMNPGGYPPPQNYGRPPPPSGPMGPPPGADPQLWSWFTA